MKSVVCPELSTAAAGSPQAPTAAVDNSAPSSTHPEPTYKSGKAVQITGTTSLSSNTVDGIITLWNRGAEKMFGYSAVALPLSVSHS
jgi:PAS domain-containing protein